MARPSLNGALIKRFVDFIQKFQESARPDSKFYTDVNPPAGQLYDRRKKASVHGPPAPRRGTCFGSKSGLSYGPIRHPPELSPPDLRAQNLRCEAIEACARRRRRIPRSGRPMK